MYEKVVYNWNRRIRSIPKQVFVPSTVEEVQEIVRKANIDHTEVRVIGTTHSLSDIIQTNGYLIRTDKFKKMEVVDANNYLVKIQTGVSIKEMDGFLQRHNMVLGTGTAFDYPTIGGVIAAGCHGTGKDYSIISDLVVAMTVVDGLGEIRIFNSEAELKYARCTLGLLGIIIDVTLQAEPASNVRATGVDRLLSEVVTATELKKLFDDNDSLELYTFPFSPNIFIKTTNAVSSQQSNFSLFKLYMGSFFTVVFAHMASPLMQRFPGIVYKLGSGGAKLFGPYDDVRSKRYAIHYASGDQYGPKTINPEYAVPFNNDLVSWQRMAEAIKALLELNDRYYKEKGQVPCVFGYNIRFTRSTTCVLSPANFSGLTRSTSFIEDGLSSSTTELSTSISLLTDDPSNSLSAAAATTAAVAAAVVAADVATDRGAKYVMWVNVLLGPNARGQEEFHQDVYKLITSQPFYGLPHWPKDWYSIPTTNAAKYADFMKFRARSGVDPNNIFINGPLLRVFNTASKSECGVAV